MKKLISLSIILMLILSIFTLAGCGDNNTNAGETTDSTATSESEIQLSDFKNSKQMLKYYFGTFVEGDNPLYGTWKMEDFDYIQFIFRNDGIAEMVMGTEGNFTELTIDESAKTITTNFYVALSGTYNYSLSDDNQTLTLTSDEDTVVLTKQSPYNMVPKAPKNPVIDNNIIGWWASENGLVYYFGNDGIMYSDHISMETCYTYEAQNGKIAATYDLGGESTINLTYSYADEVLTIDGNQFTPYNPFK